MILAGKQVSNVSGKLVSEWRPVADDEGRRLEAASDNLGYSVAGSACTAVSHLLLLLRTFFALSSVSYSSAYNFFDFLCLWRGPI